jgi:hypothetical protein
MFYDFAKLLGLTCSLVLIQNIEAGGVPKDTAPSTPQSSEPGLTTTLKSKKSKSSHQPYSGRVPIGTDEQGKPMYAYEPKKITEVDLRYIRESNQEFANNIQNIAPVFKGRTSDEVLGALRSALAQGSGKSLQQQYEIEFKIQRFFEGLNRAHEKYLKKAVGLDKSPSYEEIIHAEPPFLADSTYKSITGIAEVLGYKEWFVSSELVKAAATDDRIRNGVTNDALNDRLLGH